MNIFTISGRLTKAAEAFRTKTGKSAASFTIAHNRYAGKDKDGRYMTEAHFFDCEAYGWAADRILECSKGDEVAISGEIVQRSWENKEGAKRSKVTLLVEDIMPATRQTRHQTYEDSREDVRRPQMVKGDDVPF